MAQSWLRTYPLRWLDSSLKAAIIPFSNARDIRTYATRGYYLLGIILVFILLVLEATGRTGAVFTRLPDGPRAWLGDIFGLIGVVDVEWIVVLSLLTPYVLVLPFGPVRRFVGERTANIFFGVIDIGIRLGEWCLQHRWASLFIVIGLVGFISWGVYFIIGERIVEAQISKEKSMRKQKVKADLDRWIDQADKFSDRNTLWGDETDKYKWEVVPFWHDEEFKTEIDPLGERPHLAFALHKMLQELYSQPKPKGKPPHDFLEEKIDSLRGFMSEYQQHAGEVANTEKRKTEKRVWAIMNILMGRVCARLGDNRGAKRISYLLEAKEYFKKIDGRYSGDEDKHYRDAAHNGLGTIYAIALLPPLQDSADIPPKLCDGDAISCAEKAFTEYQMVGGEIDECSPDIRRRENNKIDLLTRIAINYESLPPGRLDLSNPNVCGFQPGDKPEKAELADCIERRLRGLMSCAAPDPSVNVHYATVAQAYGACAELKRESDPPQAKALAAAAGRYLRIAYSLDKHARGADANKKVWELCYFRFASGVGSSAELKDAFWDAIKFEPEPIPSPNRKALQGLIDKDEEKCRATR